MTDERLARVRALYDEIAFALPFEHWDEYPAVAPRGARYYPEEVTIQNNRARDVRTPCSGACPYCWISDTAIRLRRNERARTGHVGAADIAKYLDLLVSLGTTPYLAGEDTLDDLESLWWTLESYENAVAKYRHEVPKYLSSLVKLHPHERQAVERGEHRRPPAFGFTTCGFYFLKHPERLDDFFSSLRRRLGEDTRLGICVSWDPGKVFSYARRLRLTHAEVYDRMGLTLARFAMHFPATADTDIKDQKYRISMFQHDFRGDTAREGGAAFLRALVAAARRHLRQTRAPLLQVGTQINAFIYYHDRSVRWGIGEGRLGPEDFWPVRELFGTQAMFGLTCRLRNRPYLDFATGTISAEYTFPQILRTPVTPETLERTLVALGIRHPLVRNDGYFRDHVRYALAVLPELAEEPVVSAEQIVSCIYADDRLALKMELVALLDYLLTTEEKAFELTYLPPGLVPFLCADDVLEGYLRYCSSFEPSRSRLLALHATVFDDVSGGVKPLSQVVADNGSTDRGLLLRYLTRTVLAHLARKGILGGSAFDRAQVREESLGPLRCPRPPRPRPDAVSVAAASAS